MSTLLQDFRFALRSFVRAPRFSVPAILALALGIGATSATLSVVRGVLLEPLPYRNPDRVVTIWETNSERNIQRNVIAQRSEERRVGKEGRYEVRGSQVKKEQDGSEIEDT